MKNMNPKMTPEIRNALRQHPAGPVQLDDESSGEPVFLVRLSDITDLQSKLDERVRQKLAEADTDIAAGNVAPWDPEDIKRRGRARLNGPEDLRE